MACRLWIARAVGRAVDGLWRDRCSDGCSCRRRPLLWSRRRSMTPMQRPTCSLSMTRSEGGPRFMMASQSLESSILESDVIARVSYLSKRASTVPAARPCQL